MGKIFDINSPVMRFFAMVANLFVANLLFIFCCLPVVTVGASIAAMNKVVKDVVADQGDADVIKPFFRAFGENFKQATGIWLIMVIVLAMAAWSVFLSVAMGEAISKLSQTVFGIIAIVVLVVALYIFPLIVRFQNTLGRHLRNALILAIANLPRTVLITVVNAIPFLVAYNCTLEVILGLVFYWVIIGPAIGICFTNWLLGPVFRKFEPEEMTENPS